MDSAIGDQSQQVESLAPHRGLEYLVARQLARLDRVVDTRQILLHHGPGAQVQVTHLGVPHLSLGQPDRPPPREREPPLVVDRAAVVVPNGTLFGDGVCARIKEELLKEFNLHTIVRLPNGVFAPYTGIKTNLLFFTKGEPTKEIWYYEHPYPPGVKSYNKTKPIRLEEFDAEKKWWAKPGKRKENEFAWRVSIEDIVARGYNLDVKNPHTVDDAHRDPHKRDDEQEDKPEDDECDRYADHGNRVPSRMK